MNNYIKEVIIYFLIFLVILLPVFGYTIYSLLYPFIIGVVLGFLHVVIKWSLI